MNPLPPSFPMELEHHDVVMSMSRENRRKSEETKSFLKETISDHRVVGNVGSGVFMRLWSPHNYRLYFNFNRSTITNPKGRFKLLNHNSEWLLEDYESCTIKIRKNTIEITNKKHLGYWWHIHARSLDDIDKRIIEVSNILDTECIDVLRKLIKEIGGKTNYEIIRRYDADCPIKEDGYIDQINAELIIEDYPYFKKRYKDKTEIYGVTKTRDFMRNRMIEQFDHLISGAIEENSFVANPIMWLKARIKGVGDVFLYSERITLLDNKDRLEITKYLFEVENGGKRERKKNV